MASVYFVKSTGGSDAQSGLTWALAKQTLAGALTAATTNGDIIVIDKDDINSADAEVSLDTTYTAGANISIISATDDDTGTAYTPTAMSTGSWIGHSTSNRSITFTGAFSVYLYGLTIRNAGSTTDDLVFSTTAGGDFTLEDCYLWLGNSGASSRIHTGSTTASNEHWVSFINCTFRFGSTSQSFNMRVASLYFSGCSISAAGSSPTNFFGQTDGSPNKVLSEGCDWSNVGTSIIANQTSGHRRFEFRQCKVPATIMSAQTTYANRSQCEVLALDCSTADTHYDIYYANGLGELTIDTANYITADGAERDLAGNKHSWKIVTTASASFANPFITPWISVYNESTSLTPYLEMQSATTGLNESDVWSDWMYKDTANVTTARIDRADRGGVTASTTDQAASSLTDSDWTNAAGTWYFYKLSPGTITPTEYGDLSARVCVAVASATLYVDPKIRGL